MNQLPPQYAIGLVVLIILVVRRLWPAPLTVPRLLILPVVVLVLGTTGLLAFSGGVTLAGGNLVFLIVDLALSLGLGVARALTVRVEDDTMPRLYRYTVATVALWGASIVARIALDAAGRSAGVSNSLVGGTVLAMLGLGLLAQNLLTLALQSRLSDRNRPGVGSAERIQ